MRLFTVIDVPQGSDEWKAARLGRLTASKAKDAIAFSKSKATEELAARRDYRIQLVAERLTNQPCDPPVSGADIDRGNELEPAAIAAYELQSGWLVQSVGFCQHTTLMAGCSPDGVIGDFDGLIEVKAPRPANHLKYVEAGRVPAEHYAQCLHSLWITGARWLDFISYSPVFPANLALFVCRLKRDESEISSYVMKASSFLLQVDDEYQRLAGR